ncbi:MULTISPECIES: iron ABC transporter permease [unclassified Thermotoga]|uniref:FecCD family ABC transporter permease n=1 Tax=unclassified Thermotoga TaxID=2631113 RepID=UPI000541C99D|nr:MULTISPECIES: iron ABC transporter permease [unclassified Thermotoga]KAF2959366.1 iron ABC transporter permease [Thermotoga sp. 38H-to]KHC93338.1 transport system permease [Thermotoga sp. Mc24]
MVIYRNYVARRIFTILLLSFLLVLVGIYSLSHGGYSLSFKDIIGAFLGKGDRKAQLVIWSVRFPRVVAGILVGASLAVSGAVMQGVLKNPLASPFTTGTSHGAMFGASLAIALGAGYSESTGSVTLNNPYTIALFAFLGAMSSSLVIFLMGKLKEITPEAMVLMGVAMGSLFTAATALIQYFADDLELATMVYWSFGDLGRTTWRENIILLVVFLTVFAYFLWKAWDINAMVVGDEIAKSTGIEVEKVRLILVVLSTLLTAISVAFVGIIGFIGLLAPHMMRILFGEDYRFLIPLSALCGSVLLLSADTVARVLLSPTVLPVGIVTSFLGAPLFIYLLLQSKER